MVKYSNKRKRIILEVNESSTIDQIKQQIQKQFSLSIINFRLYAFIFPGFKVLLTESFPLSFFNLSQSSHIEIDPFGYNSLKSKKKSYNSTYLPTLDLSPTYTIITDEQFEKVVDYCKIGNYFSLFELILREKQLNPEDDLLNRVHPNLWSPLHYACFHGHPKIVKYLIENHVNANRVTVDEWTALQLACFTSNLDCINFLVQSKSLQINKITKFRGTALHLACERQLIEVVKILLANKASVTIKDHDGKVPFEVTQNIEIAELLAKEAGEQERLKYNEIEVVPFMTKIWQYEPFYIHDRFILLHLDHESGYLYRYPDLENFNEKKRPEASIRLGDVQNVCEYSSRLITKKDFFYFEVETSKATWRFYDGKKEIVNEWIKRIQIAANYFCAHEEHYLQKRDSLKKSIVEASEERPNVIESAPTNEEVKTNVNFDSFEILDEIGEGGFGTVYMVKKKDTEKIYAMKSQNKKKLDKDNKLVYAVRECKIMKDLDHPFIIYLYWAFQNKNSLFLVVDYCSNGDLAKLIKSRGKLDEPAARFYLAETVLALEYLHDKGIVYRDLKASNILIDSEGHIKLADFGLAKENVNAMNPAMSMAGTIFNLAPETLHQKGTTPASDIYSLGPLLYEMLTGQPIFAGEDYLTIINNIEKAKPKFPEYVSINARQLINSLMEKIPTKRPSIRQIKMNTFFTRTPFNLLLQKKIMPPLNSHQHNKSTSDLTKLRPSIPE